MMAVLVQNIEFRIVNDTLVNIKVSFTLAGVAQWIEHWPANQAVTGLTPSLGTCLGCGPGPRLGACERQPHVDVSLPLFLPPSPSLKMNKIFKKN